MGQVYAAIPDERVLVNRLPEYRQPLAPADAGMLDMAAAREVETVFDNWPGYSMTPLHSLPAMAAALRVGSIHAKDEGYRLGLGSFKALGGAYAVVRLVLEAAAARLGRKVDPSELLAPDVAAVAAGMTVACATDGNHGRSVAYGAELVGARAVVFVHAGVSDERAAAIARFGADVVRTPGTYDDSVAHASRVAAEEGWITVSDTSWPGYERIPGLVMQGYTVMVREALREMPLPPTHVFLQAGVGGMAAAVAGHLSMIGFGQRPSVVVVEPDRAACIRDSARTGHPLRIAHGLPTVMAMLECYEPSAVAWRILSRLADAFMVVDEADAAMIMTRLAVPLGADPAIVAGESGGIGLAGLHAVAGDAVMRQRLGLDANSRILAFITEGATDPGQYRALTGLDPSAVSRLR